MGWMFAGMGMLHVSNAGSIGCEVSMEKSNARKILRFAGVTERSIVQGLYSTCKVRYL